MDLGRRRLVGALLAGGVVMWIRTGAVYEAYEMSATGARCDERRESVEDRQTRLILAAAGATVFYVLQF